MKKNPRSFFLGCFWGWLLMFKMFYVWICDKRVIPFCWNRRQFLHNCNFGFLSVYSRFIFGSLLAKTNCISIWKIAFVWLIPFRLFSLFTLVGGIECEGEHVNNVHTLQQGLFFVGTRANIANSLSYRSSLHNSSYNWKPIPRILSPRLKHAGPSMTSVEWILILVNCSWPVDMHA